MPLLLTLRKLAIMMVVVCGFLGLLASTAKASTFTFDFIGTTSGGAAANGRATIVGSAGSNLLTITLTNNLTNIETVGSAISGFSFQVSVNGSAINITPVTITSQSGRLVSFNDSTTATDFGGNGSGVDPLGWGLSNQNPAYLNALGFTGSGTNPPDELILGAPTSGLTWASANGSITQSDPHQPFVDKTATFTVTLGVNLPVGFQFTNVQMYFGTNADTTGGNHVTDTPEPASMLLLGTGLMGVAAGLRRRRRARK
jgi:hypothetical protein